MNSSRALRIVTSFSVYFLLLCGCVESQGAPELPRGGTVLLSPPPFADLDRPVEEIQAWLDRERERAGYPAVSVAVVKGGRIVLLLSSGHADLGTKRPATPHTPFHVASVSKVFTSTLAARLAERGVVDLDTPVLRYLPRGVRLGKKGSDGARITLRHLASHTSGLPRGISGPVQKVEGRYALDPRLLYRELAGVELLFTPGTDEKYSNLGTGLLAHALERAARQPLEKLLEKEVLGPLELSKTGVSPAPKLEPSTQYDRTSREPEVHAYR